MTNGAFYAHFGSKEDLVVAVVAAELHTRAERFRAVPPGRAGLDELVREYQRVRNAARIVGVPC